MPKKTKKEKIIAAYRKKLRLLERAEVKPVVLETRAEEKKQVKQTVQVKQSEKTTPPKYFFSDLGKSLILIFLVIALEIGLYFAKLIK
jgi:hypothetical protein